MLKLVRTTSQNPDFRKLITLLDEDLRSRYGAEQDRYDAFNKIHNDMNVVLAYWAGTCAGSGCFQRYDRGVAELKRMFVMHAFRGKDIGITILTELELWASEMQFKSMILETGIAQPEAVALYKKAGYVVTPNYPPYKNLPASICMKKKLKSF